MGNTPKLKLNVIKDKPIAQKHIDIAELIDFYMEECYDDKLNSIARKKMTYAANSVSLLDITNSIAIFQNMELPIKLAEVGEVNIIQLMPSADGGMPHTRPGNIICCTNMSILSESTLIHELWHVHQRMFRKYWIDIFSILGWTIWERKLPDRLENIRRYNPDTIDYPLWIFKDTWVTVPVFMDITHPVVNNVEIYFYNPHTEYYTRNVPEEMASYYKNINNIGLEHPREITAYMLSEPEKYKLSPAYNDLIKAMGYTAVYKKRIIAIK